MAIFFAYCVAGFLYCAEISVVLTSIIKIAKKRKRVRKGCIRDSSRYIGPIYKNIKWENIKDLCDYYEYT